MRTTLTLDDDVAAAIERLRREGDRSFKEVINDLLRMALDRKPRAERKPVYRTVGHHSGKCRIASLDDVAMALAFAEGEDHP